MVSIIWMPLTVVAASFPSSLDWTRVILTRFDEIMPAAKLLKTSAEIPISVRKGL